MNLIDSLSVFALLLLATLALLRKYCQSEKQKNRKHPACACSSQCQSVEGLETRKNNKVDG